MFIFYLREYFRFDPTDPKSDVDPAENEVGSDRSLAFHNKISLAIKERNYKDHSYKKVNPYFPSYHSTYAGNNYNRNYDSAAINSLHPKLRKRTNDVREVVDRKLKLNTDAQFLKVMPPEPKFSSSLNTVDSLNFKVGVENRAQRPVNINAYNPAETSSRMRRSISSNHPKFHQHGNSLSQTSDKLDNRICGKEPHFTNYTVNGWYQKTRNNNTKYPPRNLNSFPMLNEKVILF